MAVWKLLLFILQAKHESSLHPSPKQCTSKKTEEKNNWQQPEEAKETFSMNQKKNLQKLHRHPWQPQLTQLLLVVKALGSFEVLPQVHIQPYYSAELLDEKVKAEII